MKKIFFKKAFNVSLSLFLSLKYWALVLLTAVTIICNLPNREEALLNALVMLCVTAGIYLLGFIYFYLNLKREDEIKKEKQYPSDFDPETYVKSKMAMLEEDLITDEMRQRAEKLFEEK